MSEHLAKNQERPAKFNVLEGIELCALIPHASIPLLVTPSAFTFYLP